MRTPFPAALETARRRVVAQWRSHKTRFLSVLTVIGIFTLSGCTGNVGDSCSDDTDCKEYAFCGDGVCASRCSSNDECGGGQQCVRGGCGLAPLCASDADCGAGQACTQISVGSYHCHPQEPECYSDFDCPEGQICDSTTEPPSCLDSAPPPAIAVCSTDADCYIDEICDASGIPECVPASGDLEILDFTFDDPDNQPVNWNWASGGWDLELPIPVLSEITAGGNPDGYLTVTFSSAPFGWDFNYYVEPFWPLSGAPLATIDFNIDVKVIEADLGVIGGEVAPIVRERAIDGSTRTYVGPFYPVRSVTTVSDWQTLTAMGLTANDFCPIDPLTGQKDCNDSDRPDFSCPASPAWWCMEGGFRLRSDEPGGETILGVDNWAMTFRSMP